MKFDSNHEISWNMHRGNNKRTGFFIYTNNVQSGDVNQDFVLDVLDIIVLINFALGFSEPNTIEFSLSDINADNEIDILDVVLLVNIILE